MPKSLSFVLLLVFSFSWPGMASQPTSSFLTDEKAAFAQARRLKKPLLISFFGIWCPPCNELEENVFESRAFLERAKAFVLLKVDADRKESWPIKDRFKVGGYPTVVFASPKGEELYRLVGYRPPEVFVEVMALALSAKGKDLGASCRSHVADDLWRCAVVCAERKDVPCARKAFQALEKQLPPGSPRYEEARTFFAENADTDDLRLADYEQLVGEFNLSPRAVLWATRYLQLCEAIPDGRKRIKRPALERVLAALPRFLDDPRLEDYGVSVTDALQAKALILQQLGQKDEAEKAWKELVAKLEAAAGELPKSSPARGLTLERIEALMESGNLEGAMKLAAEYRTRFPNEFTFHFLGAKILMREKKYADAIPVARRAYEVSYGDNKIRAATLLVELYATVPDRASAMKIYEEVTHEFRPEPRLEVRTRGYLKRLDAMVARLPAA